MHYCAQSNISFNHTEFYFGEILEEQSSKCHVKEMF